jgi:uncharacterized protein YdhG (YjbR/CyaY superfamily)
MGQKFASVDDYISALPGDQQQAARQLRDAIMAGLPGAGEKISYNIPAVTLDGTVLVHYAAWKKFVSLYPAPRADDDFERAVAPYRGAKDALRFPYTQPLPVELIGRVIGVMREQRGR